MEILCAKNDSQEDCQNKADNVTTINAERTIQSFKTHLKEKKSDIAIAGPVQTTPLNYISYSTRIDVSYSYLMKCLFKKV